jgi:toxin ParE1/3/4
VRIRLASRAEADLTAQYVWYFEQAGVEVAERFLAAFDETAARLAQLPYLGRPRRFRAAALAGIRSLQLAGHFRVHVVFYRFAGGELMIERVVHGARDLPRRLLDPPER